MKRNLFNLMAIVAIAGATLVACQPTQEPTDETNRNWSEDGGLLSADILLFGDTIGYIIMIVIGVVMTAAHPYWLRNIYTRMMRRRYENIEGFHATR